MRSKRIISDWDMELLGPEVPYLSAIGVLMYLTNYTRPDIAFSVNLLTKYSSASTKRHWNGNQTYIEISPWDK